MPRDSSLQSNSPWVDLPVQLEGLCYDFGGTAALKDVTVTCTGRGVTMIMGPNGAGKSTLLRLLHELARPTSGEIRWGPERLPGKRVRQAMVFQRPVLLRRSARANLDYALKLAKLPRMERARRAEELLSLARINGRSDKPARRLSCGEQQRLALARAIALSPEVLLLDEPTANLDPGATGQVEAIVRRISDNQVKIIMSTHDIGQARRLADEILFLHGGRLVEHGAAAALLDRPRTPELKAFLKGDLLD